MLAPRRGTAVKEFYPDLLLLCYFSVLRSLCLILPLSLLDPYPPPSHCSFLDQRLLQQSDHPAIRRVSREISYHGGWRAGEGMGEGRGGAGLFSHLRVDS
jgi:hypothetical protein